MNQFAQRIKRKLRSKGKPFESDDILQAYHLLMKWYGFISLSEFKMLPIPLVWELLELCQQEEKNEMEWKKMQLKALGAKIKF